jgi:hypothetical protein
MEKTISKSKRDEMGLIQDIEMFAKKSYPVENEDNTKLETIYKVLTSNTSIHNKGDTLFTTPIKLKDIELKKTKRQLEYEKYIEVRDLSIKKANDYEKTNLIVKNTYKKVYLDFMKKALKERGGNNVVPSTSPEELYKSRKKTMINGCSFDLYDCNFSEGKNPKFGWNERYINNTLTTDEQKYYTDRLKHILSNNDLKEKYLEFLKKLIEDIGNDNVKVPENQDKDEWIVNIRSLIVFLEVDKEENVENFMKFIKTTNIFDLGGDK